MTLHHSNDNDVHGLAAARGIIVSLLITFAVLFLACAVYTALR